MKCDKFAVKLYPCMLNSYQVVNNLFLNKSISKIFLTTSCILIRGGLLLLRGQMRRCLIMQVLANSISLITPFIELSALICR